MTGTYAGYCLCVILFLFLSLAQGYSNGIYITRQHVGDTDAKTFTERYCGCFAKIFTTKCFMALAALFGLLFHEFFLHRLADLLRDRWFINRCISRLFGLAFDDSRHTNVIF